MKIITIIKGKLFVFWMLLFCLFSFFSWKAFALEDVKVITQFDIKNAQSTISDLERDIKNITDELKKLDDKEADKHGKITQRYREVREEIVKVIKSINYTTEYISKMLEKIDSYQRNILLSVKDIKTLNRWMESSKKYVQEFTRYLYKLNNEIYTKKNNDYKIDDMKLLLKWDNIATTLGNQQLIENVVIAFNDLMNNLEWDQKKKKEIVLTLNDLKNKAEHDINDYQDLLNKLEQKKIYLIWFIKLYKKNTDLYKKFNMVFENQKDVYLKMNDLVKEISLQAYRKDIDIANSFKEVKDNYKNTNEAYPLSWPIYPAKSITTLFKDEKFIEDNKFPNLWIEIESEQGTPVHSADDGVVYHVVANDNFSINWVMIMHPNNYITVYSHLNKIVVKKGERIMKGQLLWYSGGEPWTNGAGFASNGEWLWFTIFKNWVAIDPLPLMDLSVVQQKNTLPEGYGIKFLSDKYSRDIDLTNVNFASGTTVDSRATAFLKKFAVGEYRKIDFWDRVVKNTNIDRDVVICIWFAESTLGNHLATSNNIGNVGNDDSWNRIAFDSPLFGARMIPNTLNNSHLGHYHTIKQLSRYGNSSGKVYASSPINWQTNVTKCLTQIKGYYVPEDYPFRTGLNPNR